MSGINGGWGNELDPAEKSAEEVVSDLEGWVYTVAAGMTASRPSLALDVAQEGLTAAWQANARWDPAKGAARQAWMKRHAVHRMADVVNGRPWLGQTTGKEQHYRPALVAVGTPTDTLAAEIFEQEASEAAVELAYHYGEIMKAISALTPAQRKYVVLRFWGGLSHTEMVPYFGYSPNALWSSQKNGARLKLKDALRHLEGVI